MSPAAQGLLLGLFSLVAVVDLCRGHVVLTFPPARKYALDFLDNARLPRTMCGMPKGLGPRTTILAGSTLNVTWNLGLPHKGGYKLEVLDPLERPRLDLTPMVDGSKFLDFDPTIQRHRVTLPQDFECKDCSIRLLRQATEWNPDFIMKSCADVDIVKDGYQEDCMNNGIYRDGRCYCHKTFSGGRCQHKDECMDDEDCSEHGHCIDIGGTNYPKKQCYCEMGWFGNKCDKESVHKSKELKLEQYNHHDLGPGIKLFWTILHDIGEIEIVMVAESKSYIALGWRPQDITAECKAFPTLLMPQTNKDQLEFRKAKELDMMKTSTNVISETVNLVTSLTPATQTSFQTQVAQTNITSVKDSPTTTEPVTVTTETETPTTKTSAVTSSPKIRFPPRKPNFLLHRTTSTPAPTPTQTTSTRSTETTTQVRVSQQIVMEVRSESSVQENSESEIVTSSQEYTNSDEEGNATAVPSTEIVNPHSSEKIEFSNEMDALASEEIEHVSNVEVKSYGPDGGRSKRDVDEVNDLHSNPYYSLVTLHAMDCTDMVIGSVRGEYSKIEDYYARDQSTPRVDSFWGGVNDLTSATGFETNGTTTIIFRKKLQALDKTDHSILNSTMHVIWAKGQEGNLQQAVSGNKFYTDDELKYHGSGTQRGVSAVNFYQETVKTTNNCRGEWKTPSMCTIDECEYKTVWEYHPDSADIHFTVFTNHTNAWTGIGFSRDQKMNNSDVVIGWVNDNGVPFIMDMWIDGYLPPVLDTTQDISTISGERNKSGSTIKFIRKRITEDKQQDLAFTDDECLYLIFPYHGGQYNSVSKKLKQHQKIPAVSSTKICMHACEFVPNIVAISASTVDLPPLRTLGSTFPSAVTKSTILSDDQLVFTLVIRLPLQNKVNPSSEKIQEALKAKIQDEVSYALQDVNGYKDVHVTKVQRESNSTDSLLARMNIIVDKAAVDNDEGLTVAEAINNSIAKGKIGRLDVDSKFYQLIFPKGYHTEDIIYPNAIDSSPNGHLIAIYAIIAAVSALGLLVITQIICTIYRCRKSKSTRVSKERLITNSGWKDYSTTASSNYSYEPFSSTYDESTGKVSKNPIGSGSHSGSGSNKNGHANPAAFNDSRSLSRHTRNENERNHYSRRSESLPRLNPSSHPPFRGSNYATHDRAPRNMAPRSQMELQPDFYFMPSQRRYTGEDSGLKNMGKMF